MPEPQDDFRQLLNDRLPDYRVTSNFGASNSLIARTDKARIYIAGPNLAAFPDDERTGLAVAGVARFATGTDVYLAVLIRQDVELVRQRLRRMLELQAAGNADYANRNNNTRFVFSQRHGRFFLFNKENWTDLDFDAEESGPSFAADAIWYAIYPPGIHAIQSLAAGEFVRFLQQNMGAHLVHEVSVWDDDTITPAMQRLPATVPLPEIEDTIRRMGLFFADDYVARLHMGLNHLEHKHFVILSGLSGTGKTRIVQAYASAIHGFDELHVSDPFFYLCAVRPEWTDPVGLLGYHDVLSGKYVVPPFLDAIFMAHTHPGSPIFVCLDEMNLARVEYYLADILSAMETRATIHLHSNATPLDGTTGVPVPHAIAFPTNLYLIGTINVDETTNPVSDKVLDRAVVIDMSHMDLQGYFALLAEGEPDLVPALDVCAPILTTVHNLLQPLQLEFGYRVAEEFIRYYSFAVNHIDRPGHSTVDAQILQKILVKLRGDMQHRQALSQLSAYLAAQDLPRSQSVVNRLIAELDQMGSYQYVR